MRNALAGSPKTLLLSLSLEQKLRWLGLLGWLLLFLTYFAMFSLFSDRPVMESMERATFNVLPAGLIGWAVLRLLDAYVISRAILVQLIAHFVLGILFGLLWYIGLQVGYGLQNGFPDGGIVGRGLVGVAFAWQLFQGVTLYAVVALFAYMAHYRLALEAVREDVERQAHERPTADRQQIFIKDGKTIKPITLDDVFSLSGAGDYTNVITRAGTFMSNSSLSEFEGQLPATHFIRVHRSHIINMDCVIEIESAGNGRLSLHFPSGHSVVTSRAGAKVVRDRAL